MTASHRRLAIFGLAALVFFVWTILAFVIAYDRAAAFGRLAGIVAGMVATGLLMLVGRRFGSSVAVWAGLACLLLAALISVYFLLTYDWRAAAVKVNAVNQIGLWIEDHRSTISLPGHEDINGNVAAGALVILLPLGLGGALALLRHLRHGATSRLAPVAWWLVAGLTAALSILVGITLLLTESRGGWVAMVAAMIAAAYAIWREKSATSGRSDSNGRRLDRIVLLVFIAGLILAFVVPVTWPGGPAATNGLDAIFGSATGSGGAPIGRVTLWRDMLTLVRDYPLTGSGLGTTMMVFSSYVLMLHVGYIMHAHHLLLQMAVEQGLPAMLAFGAMLGLAFWMLMSALSRPDRDRNFMLPAALAGLVALCVHGSVDAGLYVSRLAPLVFLPLGFAVVAGLAAASAASHRDSDPAHRAGLRPWIVVAAAVSVLLIAALLPWVRSAVQSNLAAVTQTRVELSIYEWPAWPLQDAVRRSEQADLAPAIQRYSTALALNPGNSSAARRLGQIEISLAQYDAASAHIQAAFDRRPSERASRQLMGEVDAIGGAVAEAANLWRTINLAQRQPDLRAWWYTNVGEPDKAERVTQAARLAGW